jgi:hypothetical protein
MLGELEAAVVISDLAGGGTLSGAEVLRVEETPTLRFVLQGGGYVLGSIEGSEHPPYAVERSR